MNSKLRVQILQALRTGKREDLLAHPWRDFDRRSWDSALTWLDWSGLAIYFFEQLRRQNRLNQLPVEVWSGLEKRRSENQTRTADMIQEVRTLTGSFEAAGVRYAVLKGISLCPDYFPDPELRTQYDHDVLVDDASLVAAENVLKHSGYALKAREGAAVVYRKPEPPVRFSDNAEGLYSPLLGRSIELHLALWESGEERIPIDLPEDFLERRQMRRWKDLGYAALCDEDSLLFQVLHAFKHILRNWCRLSVLLEISSFLDQRSSDEEFWRKYHSRIAGIRWAPEASFVVFSLAARLFPGSHPGRLPGTETSLAPALTLWIERYGLNSALSNFHGDKCSLFLHREFVESSKEWSAIRKRRLFPIQRPHRPPAVVFQRGFSVAGKCWLEFVHALRRLRFHGLAGLQYALEYPRWALLRNAQQRGTRTS